VLFINIHNTILLVTGVETNVDPTGETLRISKLNVTETRKATIKKSAIWERQP